MISSAPGHADGNMLAARFVTGPHVRTPVKAEARLNDWLAELEPAQAAGLRSLLHEGVARTILLGIAEHSPYLFDLIRADAARLLRLLRSEPQSHLTRLIEATSRAALSIRPARCESGSQPSSRARRAGSERTRSFR